MEQIPKPEGQSIFSGLNKETNTMNFYGEEYGYEYYAVEEERGISPRNDEMPIFTQSEKPISVLSDGTKLYPIPIITEFFNPENETHVGVYKEAIEGIVKKNQLTVEKIINFNKGKNKSLINSPAKTMLSKEDLKENPFFNGDYIKEIRYLEEMCESTGHLLSCLSIKGSRFKKLFECVQDLCLSFVPESFSGQIRLLAGLLTDNIKEGVGLYNISDWVREVAGNSANGWIENQNLDSRKRCFEGVLAKVESHELRAKMNALYQVPLELIDKVSLPVLKILISEIDKGNILVYRLLASGVFNGTEFSEFIEKKGYDGAICSVILNDDSIKFALDEMKPEDIRRLFDIIVEDEKIFNLLFIHGGSHLFDLFRLIPDYISYLEVAIFLGYFENFDAEKGTTSCDEFIRLITETEDMMKIPK